jgi:hypothetical protein
MTPSPVGEHYCCKIIAATLIDEGPTILHENGPVCCLNNRTNRERGSLM